MSDESSDLQAQTKHQNQVNALESQVSALRDQIPALQTQGGRRGRRRPAPRRCRTIGTVRRNLPKGV
jgi:hypothetical protein